MSVTLHWDSKIVEPVGMTAGADLMARDGVALSPAAGTVDMALLGVNGRGMSGLMATVRFRSIAAGDPGIGVEHVIGRDGKNNAVAVKVGAPIASANVATSTELQSVAPNPARINSVISFSLAVQGRVDLSIFSVDGRRVRTLVNGEQQPGNYRFSWNATDDAGNRSRRASTTSSSAVRACRRPSW